MRLSTKLVLATTALALSACVSAAPLKLTNDNPASPRATAGLIDSPTAIDDYKGPDAFAAQAAADAKAPQGGHMQHGGMSGMGSMGGMHMQHGTAPQGGGSQ